MSDKFETVVRVVSAMSNGKESPRVSAQIEGSETVLRISEQAVVYRGNTLDDACDSLLANWGHGAADRVAVLERMASWLREAYGIDPRQTP